MCFTYVVETHAISSRNSYHPWATISYAMFALIRNSISNYVLNYVIGHTKYCERITKMLCNLISITL